MSFIDVPGGVLNGVESIQRMESTIFHKKGAIFLFFEENNFLL